MHEASLAQGLLKIVLDAVADYNAGHPEQPAGRVTDLTLGLGLLSCVEVTTFTGCFELLSEGTLAEGARVHIEREPLRCTCHACKAVFDLTERLFVCPVCQGKDLSFAGGHGLTLLGLEVEHKSEPAPAMPPTIP